MTIIKNNEMNKLIFDLNKIVLFRKEQNNSFRQYSYKLEEEYFNNMYSINLKDYIENMLKLNDFEVQSVNNTKHLKPLNDSREVTRDNLFSTFTQPILVHTIKRENESVLAFMYLNKNGLTYYMHMTYLVRKDNQTYIATILLNDKESNRNYLKEDYTSDTFLNHLYDQCREYLLSVTPYDSYHNFFSEHLMILVLSNICSNKEYKEDFIELIYSLYPFMMKYKEKVNNDSHVLEDYYPSIMTYLLDEVYFPYKQYLHVSSYQSSYHSSSYGRDDLTFLMEETEPLKQVKYFIPKANKHTVKALRNLFDLNSPPTYSENRINNLTIYMEIFKLFNNQNNLVEFIKAIETPDPYGFNLQVEVNVLSKTSYSVLNDFIKNHLKDLFTSQKKMEEYLVQFLKDASENLNKQIDSYIEDRKQEIDEDFDYDEDFPSFHLNLEELNEKLYDLTKVRSYVVQLIENLSRNKTDENLLKIELLQKALDTKTNDIVKSHDLLTEKYYLVSNAQTTFTSVQPKLVTKDNLSVIEILDNYSLRKVGDEMHHCVSTYNQAIINEEVSIFVVKDTESNEFVGCLEFDRKKKAIVQAKSKYNFLIRKKEVLSLIKDFYLLNNFDIKTNDLPYKNNVTSI